MPNDFVGVTKISPGVQEVSRNDVVGFMMRTVEIFLLLLKLGLEFLQQILIPFVFFRGELFGRATAGGCCRVQLNVHKFDIIQPQLTKSLSARSVINIIHLSSPKLTQSHHNISFYLIHLSMIYFNSRKGKHCIAEAKTAALNRIVN